MERLTIWSVLAHLLMRISNNNKNHVMSNTNITPPSLVIFNYTQRISYFVPICCTSYTDPNNERPHPIICPRDMTQKHAHQWCIQKYRTLHFLWFLRTPQKPQPLQSILSLHISFLHQMLCIRNKVNQFTITGSTLYMKHALIVACVCVYVARCCWKEHHNAIATKHVRFCVFVQYYSTYYLLLLTTRRMAWFCCCVSCYRVVLRLRPASGNAQQIKAPVSGTSMCVTGDAVGVGVGARCVHHHLRSHDSKAPAETPAAQLLLRNNYTNIIIICTEYYRYMCLGEAPCIVRRAYISA